MFLPFAEQRAAIDEALSFLSGFEGDELQEGLDGPTGLLARFRAAVEALPKVPVDDIGFAAAVLWEIILDQRVSNPELDLYFGNHGSCEVRMQCAQWAEALELDWIAARDGGYDNGMDWEFTPEWLRLNVTFNASGPILKEPRAAVSAYLEKGK